MRIDTILARASRGLPVPAGEIVVALTKVRSKDKRAALTELLASTTVTPEPAPEPAPEPEPEGPTAEQKQAAAKLRDEAIERIAKAKYGQVKGNFVKTKIQYGELAYAEALKVVTA